MCNIYFNYNSWNFQQFNLLSVLLLVLRFELFINYIYELELLKLIHYKLMLYYHCNGQCIALGHVAHSPLPWNKKHKEAM